MPTVFSVSTDRVAKRDRFAYWREAVSERLTFTSVECAEPERDRFFARLDGVSQGGAALLQFERSGVTVHRGAREIEQFPNDNLLVYCAPAVATWISPHDGEAFVAPPGSIVVGYADAPLSQAPLNGVDYRCILATLPAALAGLPRARAGQRAPRAIASDAGLGALLIAQLEAWSRAAAALDAEAFDLAALSLAQLAALAHGSGEPREDRSREAVAVARRAAAERFITQNLHRADLSPALVAAKLEMPVRRLHALFEPTGISAARRILAQRLAAAKRLLIGLPDLPVTDVAYRCGFESLATFYRAFKTAFAMTATEFRSAQSKRL
ncbi:MAG: AraC family transcriptional regulator [Bradyrhizobium sp.]|nr:MAG: AraC family transcriptional regulator [Bradyrhizobium sp.]